VPLDGEHEVIRRCALHGFDDPVAGAARLEFTGTWLMGAPEERTISAKVELESTSIVCAMGTLRPASWLMGDSMCWTRDPAR
jgi:hypothetical protein